MTQSTSASKSENRYAAWLVAAAFIGPGTVTTASIAGAQFGYHVLWALCFSIVATWVLQDMAVRLGVSTKQGLAEAIQQAFQNRGLRLAAVALVIAAIGIGNAAYEGGNITGAALGLSQLTNMSIPLWVMCLSVIAGVLLWFGQSGLIERVLVGLVGVMSLIFIVTVIVAKPDIGALFTQALAPRFDSATFTVVLALIGTTIVPYNLFLHASLVSRYEGDSEAEMQRQRRSNSIAILAGGLITLAIMTTATATFFGSDKSLDASNIASQLSPLLGDMAANVFAIGLFAAGLTSAVTAPLAASYAVCGALGRKPQPQSTLFRSIWLTVLVTGAIVASVGFKPLTAMLFAQATNGMLLPFIAIFLLVAMNQRQRVEQAQNSLLMNALGLTIVLFTLALGARKVLGVF
ncbi:Nramp family divalent metal transporter [Alteromonas sp. ASW11-36]|uniref:Nramp family divalent metal transporter n=1 Tax=Alteromonas arenosi TaxID=3055817 RepID=A0ABT7T003_9ALTE|nr:Nramp family divalent metal transporter [Alteromonas sp. ASW11-36]MDM7861776.1 Nramp family divalent metal transporter [Alteromonas sp. ASW11-36]